MPRLVHLYQDGFYCLIISIWKQWDLDSYEHWLQEISSCRRNCFYLSSRPTSETLISQYSHNDMLAISSKSSESKSDFSSFQSITNRYSIWFGTLCRKLAPPKSILARMYTNKRQRKGRSREGTGR